MPNRIIKESICDSERINKLTPIEEVTFYRLLVNADDYGCFDAREAVVKSRLFPLKDAMKLSEVGKILDRLAEVGLIVRYTKDGKPFLCVNKWGEHQRLRVSRHKYPTPDEADCGTLRQLAATCGEKSLESESESESEIESESERRKAQDRWFEKFWSVYPRKVNKVGARKAFDRIRPDESLLNRIIAAVEKQKTSDQWTKDGGQFIPHPATWLNGHRWEDELAPAKPGKIIPAQDFQQRDYSGVQRELEEQQRKHIIEALCRENGLWDEVNNRPVDGWREKLDAMKGA